TYQPATVPPPPAIVLPPPEHIESVEDDIETLHARLASAEQETVTLCAKVETLEQHNEVTLDSWRIARGRITWLLLRVVANEQQVIEQTGDRVHLHRAEMTRQDVEALHARAVAAEQRAETLQASLGVAQIDITDLLESCKADRLEMAELRSRALDIKASF
nr:hypothetical protein [Tanacetum cinerariifolium]